MAAIPQVTKGQARSYTPAAGQYITGGQVVEATTGGRIRVATAASTRVVGVAVTDATAPEGFTGNATLVNGRPVLNTVVVPTIVAVAHSGTEVPVTFSAATAFGQLVIAAANGQVAPAGAAPAADQIVGRCTSPGGVSGAGVTGLVRLA